MKRAAILLPFVLLATVAHARGKAPDERFFDAFLPIMVGVGVLIVVLVVVANVVSARRRGARLRTAFDFDPTLGGNAAGNLGRGGTPGAVSTRTTTTHADGSVTVTVVERSTVGSAPFGGIDGVVDPELTGNGIAGSLEERILNEVRDALRDADVRRDTP